MFNKENLMIKNVFILSFAAVISKFLGAFYQAFLYRAVGPAGIALYMRGINIYTILLAISSAGIPIAISKLMAEEIARGYNNIAYKLFKISLILLIFSGLLFSLILFFLAPFISNIIFDSPIVWVLQALSPAIFIVTIMSSLRGFFQGQQNMFPTAYSQIIEQLVRIAFSVIITLFYLKTIFPISITKIIDGVALGPFIGSLFGLILLLIYYYKNKNKLIYYKNNCNCKKNKKEIKTKIIIKRILLFAIPTTLASLLPTLIDFSDMIIIPRILKGIGFSIKEADCFLGYFSGAVLTLINIVTLIAASFSISLVPAISNAKARNAMNEVSKKTMISTKLVLLIALPFSFGMYFLGKPILELIFGSGEAINILKFSVLMIIFMSIYHSTTGILQGIGKTYIPLLSLGIGLIVNVICLYLFINIRCLNIFGAALAHTICFFIAAIINYLNCKKTINFKMYWNKWFFQAIISSILTSLILYYIYYIFKFLLNILIKGFINNLISLALILIISIILYPMLLIILKGIKKEEIINIPKIGFIFKIIFKNL